MACPCFKSLNNKKWRHIARRYCSRYNDKYKEWFPVAEISTLTDDCEAILKSDNFNKTDPHYGQGKKEMPTSCKIQWVDCCYFFGRLSGNSYEKAV
jgi:hypothetical protein